MKKIPPILLALFCTILIPLGSLAQTADTLYYSDARYWNKVKKSNYMRIISEEDGITTEVRKNDKRGNRYLLKQYKGEEPVGVWEKLTKRGVEYTDYDFDVEYTTNYCPEMKGQDPVRMLLFDIKKINYQSPKILIKGEQKFFSKVFHRHFDPPKHFRTRALQGKLKVQVDVQFTVTETGKIENIKVVDGQSVEVDKEVIRTLKQMSFTTPPMLNGKPTSICAIYPVRILVQPSPL